MATIRHENKENVLPEMRKNAMAAQQKRQGLTQRSTNVPMVHQRGGKQPLGASNSIHVNKLNIRNNLKDVENIADKENRKQIVNPIVPVAQFEAFTVYEDNSEVEGKAKNRIRTNKIHVFKDNPETKLEIEDREKITTDVEEKEAVAHEFNDFMGTPTTSPMSVQDVLSESISAEDVIIRGGKKSPKDLFFEMEEYRSDIYGYLREHELRNRPKPGYMRKQPDVTSSMRTILVDWLVEVAEEYKLHNETLYLAVNYIDRFLSYMSVVRAKLQLVGTAAMFLAAKYEEIMPPGIEEFVYITDDTYNKRQILRMEHLILKVLGFDLSVPTPLTFITAMCVSNKLSQETTYLAMYLSELSLLNGDVYLDFLPSTLAASAIAIARHTLGFEAWNDKMAESTGYEIISLKSGIEFLHQMFEGAPTMVQHAIYDKYKSPRYLSVSQTKPRDAPILFN